MATFLDEVEIEVQAGKGGNGAVSFRREAFVPHGGPNGGDGGRGGNVELYADSSLSTLLDLRYKQKYKAEPGGDGAGGDKHGKNGEDLILKVPPGTIAIDLNTGKKIADLVEAGETFVLAKGGSGGNGNVHYKSSARQAPRFAQQGEPGEKKRIKLELKLIADVGIVGYPNAGKSTFISRVSAAKPKVADYPFTTLVPNLGVVRAGDHVFVMADMPGLIEGAHEGVGLGDRFLKHIERTRVLLHLVDMSPIQMLDPVEAFDNINRELELYGGNLIKKPMAVGLNKIDTLSDEGQQTLEQAKRTLEERGYPVFTISGVTGEGIEPLLYHLADTLSSIERQPLEPEDTEERIEVLSPRMKPKKDWRIEQQEPDVYHLESAAIERMVAMTDLNNEEAVMYLHQRLQKMGVIDALREAGCEEGDTVRIGEIEFDFVEGV